MQSSIKVGWNVLVKVRRFYPDNRGSAMSLDGQRGFFTQWEEQNVHNLLTDAGRDFLHLQGYETTGLGTNGGNYIALTVNTDVAADVDTTLAGEITNNGLERTQGTVAHVAGNTTSTVINTFTASDTHTAVQKTGLFTAASVGTLVHEATFTPATLIANDQLSISWTITVND